MFCCDDHAVRGRVQGGAWSARGADAGRASGVSPEEAARAAVELGYPVVAKLCGEHVAHKTERGLVKLRLGDADAVRRATEELLAAGRPEDAVTGVIVALMASGTAS